MKRITPLFLLILIIPLSWATPSESPVTGQTASTTDVALQVAYSQAIGQDDMAYHFQPNEAGYTATNPAHQFTISVSDDMVTVTMNDGSWRLSSQASASKFSLEGNHLTLHRDGYDEWYINGPAGLQQGFTLYQPADIAFTVGGTLPTMARPQSLSIGDAFVFSGLMAYDAHEQPVPVEFDLDDNRLVYAYDDTDATYPLTIDPWVQQAKLLPLDGVANAVFGWSVALDGDTALVGSPGSFLSNSNSGNAYVFVRSGTMWVQQAKLTPADGAAEDFFGRSVALSGNTALIGSPSDDDNGGNSGSAYVFVRSGTTWSQQAKLTASDGAGGDQFGTSVDLDGDTALIGAPYGDATTANIGTGYVFTRSGTTWGQQAKLVANDASYGDQFGGAVALEGDTALIGAHFGDGITANTGSAYVFTRSGTTWSQQTELVSSDGAAYDIFGADVALSGNTALVTAFWDDDQSSNTGSAYVFTRSGTVWTQQAKLLPSEITFDDNFGGAADIHGDTVVVAATGDIAYYPGYVFVFTRSGTTWYEQGRPMSSDAANSDSFGSSVAVDGDTLLVGAFGDDDNGSSSGSAYAFTLEPGVLIIESEGDTEVNEGNVALTDSYTIVLDASPDVGETVTINLSSNTTTGVSVSPSNLSFNASNWRMPQTVTVTAVDDSVFESYPHVDTITHSLSTNGAVYGGITVRDVVVTILENDQFTLAASAACNDQNLEVTITSGDGPFNITASAGVNIPIWGVGTGTTIITGPEKWDDVTVRETAFNRESINLGQFRCRSDERPTPLTPVHQEHTTNPFPLFSWTGLTDANNYRVFVFDDQDQLLRTVDIRENSGGPTQLTLSTPLPDGRLFWRVRGRTNRIWSRWSIRFTLFKDPPVLFDVPAAEPAIETAPAQVPAPTNHPSSDGSAPPERDLPPTVPAPPPTDLPQPPNSR